ncbi:poly(3-hydroxybutyrate) depolymerase [Roseateles asaccharophilus]|uniref:hypothetical protein n=1 Tax=Roseateles asaccharophilus TaxID=582607 RepID=UPI00383282D2
MQHHSSLATRVDHGPDGDRSVHFWRPTDANVTFGVFLLHPTGGNGLASMKAGRWMEQPGVAVCAPVGLGFNPTLPAGPDNPRAWSSLGGPMVNRTLDDAGYLLALARQFKATLPSGTPLVLVGHSNGCAIGFNCLLALDDHPFDAAALYAANWADPRPSAKRIPLLYMCGDSDPIYPYAKNTPVATPWFSYETVRAEVTVEAWLSAMGLGESPSRVALAPLGWHRRWLGDDGLTFEFAVLTAQGHHWPAGLPLDTKLQRVLGPNNEDLDATAYSLAFFSETLGIESSTPAAANEVVLQVG